MEFMMEHKITCCCSTCDLSWTDWSPDINWEHIAGAGDVHGFFDSMILDIDLDTLPIQAWSTSVSPSSTNCHGTPAGEHPPEEDDRTLRLVHLLMAAAEALDGPCKSPHLAQVILARLRQLLARGGASSIDRLAVHFTNALHGLLDGGDGGEEPPNHSGEVLVAFHLLQDMSPYMKFGHFTANQAILEAVSGERRVHVVDYDIMEGVQWASLMQALMEIDRGFARPHLRITAGALNRRSVKETGRRLASFAASIGLSFSFGLCQLDRDEKFRPAAVKVLKGEAVVLNCVLRPSSADGAGSFLASAAELRARLVTLVDQEREQIGFVGSFMEEMNRYSAMCDALEAGFPKQGRARETVERVVLASMIAGAVGRAYRRAAEEERLAECLEAAEFRKAGLSFFNLCQARLLLGLFNDGYHVEEDGGNKIVLCWKSCRLISASVWSAPPQYESPEGNYFRC